MMRKASTIITALGIVAGTSLYYASERFADIKLQENRATIDYIKGIVNASPDVKSLPDRVCNILFYLFVDINISFKII